MSEYKYHLTPCPQGWLALLGRGQGLRRLSLQPNPQEALEGLGPLPPGAQPDAAAFQPELAYLSRYFDGDLEALGEIRVDLEDAPPFFKAAWEACRRIPPGETRSYAWLAAQAGNPLAVRAAGQAMARNRLVLIIPCHRVIGSDGGLHGYGAGGLPVKARLLALEQAAASRVA